MTLPLEPLGLAAGGGGDGTVLATATGASTGAGLAGGLGCVPGSDSGSRVARGGRRGYQPATATRGFGARCIVVTHRRAARGRGAAFRDQREHQRHRLSGRHLHLGLGRPIPLGADLDHVLAAAEAVAGDGRAPDRGVVHIDHRRRGGGDGQEPLPRALLVLAGLGGPRLQGGARRSDDLDGFLVLGIPVQGVLGRFNCRAPLLVLGQTGGFLDQHGGLE